METVCVKVTFIPGLRDIVLEEINGIPELLVQEKKDEAIYFPYSNLDTILSLKSILNAYLVKQGDTLNPYYLSKHKSILGEIIELVIKENSFKTFKLSCAGPDSKEVREIKRYIASTYKVEEQEDADMEIFIGKSHSTWEIGVRATPRPLSLRSYKVENIKGGLNPTIAYAMNTFCNLDSVQSYLNIFSGSGTLLIEAGLTNKELKLIGFDINGKSNALAVKNIKKAGLIKSIQLKTANLLDKPALGKFDVIASDLPFGMQISKGEDLERLYRTFIEYSEEVLHLQGTLVVYTTEHTLLAEIIDSSKFFISNTLDLILSTVTNAYIHPKIFVCKLKP